MALADALERVEHTEEGISARDFNEKQNKQKSTSDEVLVRSDISSLKRVMLGENKILSPEAPWVVNLRASRFVENAYMW